MQKHLSERILHIFLMQVAGGASICFRNLFNGLRDRPVKQGCSMHTNGKTKWSINVTASSKYSFLICIMFPLNFLKLLHINLFAQITQMYFQVKSFIRSFVHIRIIYKFVIGISIKFKLIQIKRNYI